MFLFLILTLISLMKVKDIPWFDRPGERLN